MSRELQPLSTDLHMIRINHLCFQGDPGQELNAIRTTQLKEANGEKSAENKTVFFLIKSM